MYSESKYIHVLLIVTLVLHSIGCVVREKRINDEK